jgi:tRNA(Ile)-lysidine synthase
LSLPRAAIDAYARAAGLEWVDDESNADTGVKRNFIRRDIAPRLAAAFPGYPATSRGRPLTRPRRRAP